MGFILDVDLETSEGPSHEVYGRIESLTFNKVTSTVQFQITYWVDQKSAIKFNRTFLDEEQRNAEGLVQERVLYFKDEESEGEEVLFKHHMKVPLVTEKEIEVPKYEMQAVEREVPYVSFDENGDEVTKLRTVIAEEKVRVGTEIKKSEVIDTSLLRDIFGFCYKKIYEDLAQHIPVENIITVK